jgi:hypothetical protein
MKKNTRSVLAVILEGKFKPEKFEGQILDILQQFDNYGPVRMVSKGHYLFLYGADRGIMLQEQLQDFIRKYALEECICTGLIPDLNIEVEMRFTKHREFRTTSRAVYGKEQAAKLEKFYSVLGVEIEEAVSAVATA